MTVEQYLLSFITPLFRSTEETVDHSDTKRSVQVLEAPFWHYLCSSTFQQKAKDQILSGLPGVQFYQDDLLITGPDEQLHLRNLDAILQRLVEYGLRARKDKCEFFLTFCQVPGTHN